MKLTSRGSLKMQIFPQNTKIGFHEFKRISTVKIAHFVLIR